MRQVLWGEVSDLVKQANLQLWELINSIKPGADLPLFLANYHYGDYIFEKGKIRFPFEKNTLLGLDALPERMKHSLNRNKIPLGLILNKSVELFSGYDEKVEPLTILKAGRLIGLFELFAANSMDVTQLNISAGVRTAFLLPNVLDSTHHKKLVNIYQAPEHINSVFDHWDIFKKIANYRFHNRYWLCDVLFFSNVWLEKISQAETLPWSQLKNYFFEQAWRHTISLSHVYNNCCLKNCLLQLMSDHKSVASDYMLEIVKYILLVQQGYAPGFQVSDGSEQYLPERVIQDAYIQDYKLRTYLPVIMHAALWDQDNNKFPLYYSLNLPITFCATMPDLRNLRKTELLRQCKLIMDHLELAGDCHYRYMHRYTNVDQGIEKAFDLFAGDPRVMRLKDLYPNLEISSSSGFVQGCIQLQKKEK